MKRISRNTRQKEIIKKKVLEFNSFFNAYDLKKRVNQEDASIGIATIYRFLKEEEKDRKLSSYTCDRKKIYSISKKSHCHFNCEKTGKRVHFEIDNLDFLKNKIPGKISSFQLEVNGICEDCKN